ncbi:hypothetical protein AB1N83_011868 [Pleurotus pulmonarius]
MPPLAARFTDTVNRILHKGKVMAPGDDSLSNNNSLSEESPTAVDNSEVRSVDDNAAHNFGAGSAPQAALNGGRPPISTKRANNGADDNGTDGDGRGHIQNYSGSMNGSNVGGVKNNNMVRNKDNESVKDKLDRITWLIKTMSFNEALIAIGELRDLQQELDRLSEQRKKADQEIRLKYNAELKALSTVG